MARVGYPPSVGVTPLIPTHTHSYLYHLDTLSGVCIVPHIYILTIHRFSLSYDIISIFEDVMSRVLVRNEIQVNFYLGSWDDRKLTKWDIAKHLDCIASDLRRRNELSSKVDVDMPKEVSTKVVRRRVCILDHDGKRFIEDLPV